MLLALLLCARNTKATQTLPAISIFTLKRSKQFFVRFGECSSWKGDDGPVCHVIEDIVINLLPVSLYVLLFYKHIAHAFHISRSSQYSFFGFSCCSSSYYAEELTTFFRVASFTHSVIVECWYLQLLFTSTKFSFQAVSSIDMVSLYKLKCSFPLLGFQMDLNIIHKIILTPSVFCILSHAILLVSIYVIFIWRSLTTHTRTNHKNPRNSKSQCQRKYIQS